MIRAGAARKPASPSAIAAARPPTPACTNRWVGGLVSAKTLALPLDQLGDATKIIGSGPFVVAREVLAREIAFKAREDYAWGPPTSTHGGRAHLDGIKLIVTPEDILASRTVFVADDAAEARPLAEIGLRRGAERLVASGHAPPGSALDDIVRASDAHLGAPDEVIASLRADRTLARATDLAVQVHSVDPPHRHILHSIERVAGHVAPALGWPGAEAVRARPKLALA